MTEETAFSGANCIAMFDKRLDFASQCFQKTMSGELKDEVFDAIADGPTSADGSILRRSNEVDRTVYDVVWHYNYSLGQNLEFVGLGMHSPSRPSPTPRSPRPRPHRSTGPRRSASIIPGISFVGGQGCSRAASVDTRVGSGFLGGIDLSPLPLPLPPPAPEPTCQPAKPFPPITPLHTQEPTTSPGPQVYLHSHAEVAPNYDTKSLPYYTR